MYLALYILPAMSSGYRPERVKTLRTRLGMTQKQLAEAAGTSQGDISRIERGAWAPSGWELLPDHVERNVVNGVRATGKAQRARWGARAWPCEALWSGGVVILGECDMPG